MVTFSGLVGAGGESIAYRGGDGATVEADDRVLTSTLANSFPSRWETSLPTSGSCSKEVAQQAGLHSDIYSCLFIDKIRLCPE